jgi:hypothetical protein
VLFRSPDGTFSAGKLIPSTEDDSHFVIVTQSTVLAPSKASISFYVKPAGHNFFQIASGQTAIEFATFDLQSGTISETGSATNESECSISPVGNGFYRVSVFIQPSATGTTYSGSIPSGTLGWRPSFTGDGVSGVYVWGAQFEALPFASSYIRTEGSAVSRSADDLRVASAGNFDADEYTIAIEGNASGTSTTNTLLCVSDSTNSNRLQLTTYQSKSFGYFAASGGNTQGFAGTGPVTNDTIKGALTYTPNNLKGYFNGDLFGTDTSSLPLQNDNTIFIGSMNNTIERLFGHMGKVSIYAQALTAQEITLL